MTADEMPLGMSRYDRDKFQTLWDAHLRRKQGETPDVGRDSLSSPEVYVARAPKGGIPALDPDPFGNIPERGTGTGSATFDQPGSALCQIYKIVAAGTGSGTGSADYAHLTHVRYQRRRIYNLSGAEIPVNAWMIVQRDKFGSWFAVKTQEATTPGDRWEHVKVLNNTAHGPSLYRPGVLGLPGDPEGERVLVELVGGTCFVPETYYDGKYEGLDANPFVGSGSGTADVLPVYSCRGSVKHIITYCDPVTNQTKCDLWVIPYPFIVRTNIGCSGTGSGTAI